MRDENPDDQINSDEDDDEEEDNDANAVVDPPPSSSPGLQHIGKYTVKKWIWSVFWDEMSCTTIISLGSLTISLCSLMNLTFFNEFINEI